MAHPETPEAVDAPVSDMDSAAAAISKLNLGGDEPDEEQESEAPNEADPDEGEVELDDDEQEGEESEPQSAAIAAPASLNAEEKAAFAAASPEAQRAWAAAETRRNTQVQDVTTKASEAQRTADARAAQADAEARKGYANQLMTVIQAFAPEAPDPDLARTDPGEYIAQKAQYDAAHAQLGQFAQQVQAMGQEADGQIDQVFITERDRALNALPEVQNPDTREGFFQKAIEAATALELDAPALNRATAQEWAKLRQVHDWKTKADKYDAALSRQMQRVRDGKRNRPNKPNAPQGDGAGRSLREATARAKSSGDLHDAAAAIAKLG